LQERKLIAFKKWLFVLACASQLAACGGGGDGGSVRPPPQVTLKSIVVSPGAVQVATGGTQQFKAQGTYSDGSTQDVTARATWSSDNPTAVAVSNAVSQNGLATVLASGTANVVASLDGIAAPSATFTASARQLPLEVFGAAGHRESLQVNLADVAGVSQIYLRCHSCGYHDNALDADATLNKASLILPGGRTVRLKFYSGGRLSGNDRATTASHQPDVRDASVSVMEPEQSYGGIGGGFRTVRMTIALQPGDLVVGSNTFTFEHTHPDNKSIGFRIIDFNLVSSQGAKLLAPGTLGFDDPSTWTAPSTAAADVAAGKTLWSKPDTLQDPYFASLAHTPTGTTIHAACADCHTADGRDLHYFRFSNAAIIARSVFHGLSARQGAQIASYIRQLNVPAPAMAWPWNPPYQPGPGIDSRPVEEWAAGAGVSAVLDDDRDMRPYLFPKGTSTSNSVAGVVNRFGTLNMRELPVAIQLPDWNSWLPRVHPKDAFNSQVLAVRSPYGASPPAGQPNLDSGKLYPEVAYAALKALAPGAMTDGVDAFIASVDTWIASGATCFTQTADSGPPFRALDSDVFMHGLSFGVVPSVLTPADCINHRHDLASTGAIEEAKRGLAAWTSVKQWEIIHSNRLETASQARPVISIGRSPASTTVDPSEHFGWGQTRGGGNGGVFFRAAHFLGYNSAFFHDEDPLVSHYGTTAWYHLQLVLNPGYRTSMPSHFPYTLLYITNVGSDSSLATPANPRYDSFRYWASVIKMRQLQTNGVYGKEVGLDLRTAQPFFYYADQRGNTSVPAGVDASGSPPGLWKSLVQSALSDLVADAGNASAADWANAIQNSVVQLPDAPVAEFTPCGTCFPGPGYVPGSGMPFSSPGRTQGTNTLRLIPRLVSDVQLDAAAVNSLIQWSDTMWPQAAASFNAMKQ
jgi:cytochrome c553